MGFLAPVKHSKNSTPRPQHLHAPYCLSTISAATAQLRHPPSLPLMVSTNTHFLPIPMSWSSWDSTSIMSLPPSASQTHTTTHSFTRSPETGTRLHHNQQIQNMRSRTH